MIISKPLEENLTRVVCTEKYIKIHYPDFYQYILDNYPEELTWTEKLYWYYHNIIAHPSCPICGKHTKFKSLKLGYRKFCSAKCCNSDEEKKSRIKQTCLEKYGVKNPSQSESIKNKIKETNLERYGVEYPNKSPEIQNKYKQTCLERYGVEKPLQSQEIQNKYKRTCLERYGVENPFRLDVIKDKIKETYLKRDGVEHPAQSQKIQDKMKQTCLDKYGVECYLQSEEVRNKIKQTCLDKYGTENYTQSQEFQSRHDEIQNKVKQTCLNKYGVENYTQSSEFQSRHDEIQTKINNTKRLNHTFSSSEIETLFSKYLDSQHIEYKRQYRSKEYPFNCDFYLPKYDLYIEIQASWTHGGHPYDCDEETDKDILESWKSKNNDYYNNAIETWTERDVKKREIAKQSHLKHLEIFSNKLDEIIKTFQQFLISL